MRRVKATKAVTFLEHKGRARLMRKTALIFSGANVCQFSCKGGMSPQLVDWLRTLLYICLRRTVKNNSSERAQFK